MPDLFNITKQSNKPKPCETPNRKASKTNVYSPSRNDSIEVTPETISAFYSEGGVITPNPLRIGDDLRIEPPLSSVGPNTPNTVYKRNIRQDIMNDHKMREMLLKSIKKDLLNDEEIKERLIANVKLSLEDDLLTAPTNKDEEAQGVSASFKAMIEAGNATFSLFPWDPLEARDQVWDRTRGLENDTFTIMMLSTRYGFAWFFLFTLFLVQLCLLMGILEELLFQRDRDLFRTLHVPIANKLTVTVGQSLAIIFAIFSQRDLLEGVAVFVALMKHDNYAQLNILPNGERVRNNSTLFWIEKVFFSYFIKLSVSVLTLFTAMVLILQSNDLIDLLKDFTALFIVASLDNFVYASIGDGYFGHLFDKELKRKERIKIKAETRFTFLLCKKIPVQSLLFGLLLASMLTIWGYVGYKQISGIYFFESHPNCRTAFDLAPSLQYHYWGDDYCDPRLYTEQCGMDGGDCNDYCMTKWMAPSLELYLDVQNSLENERSESCGLNSTIIYANKDGNIIVNGLKPNNDLSFDFSDLPGEFSKCFNESSIYNTGHDYNLGLFCYFGDFRQEFSGRDNIQKDADERRLRKVQI